MPNSTPLDVYFDSEYEPDAEYVDGGIEERPVGDRDHSAWQEAISSWFRDHRAEWNLRIFPGVRVQVSPTCYRVPDVTIVDRSLREPGRIITHPPVAVFEVLSPGQSLRNKKWLRKLKDYQAMGIEQIWMVNPETGEWHRFVDGESRQDINVVIAGKTLFTIDQIASELDI